MELLYSSDKNNKMKKSYDYEKIKNLILLSEKLNIDIFTKKHNIKQKNKILKECELIKKKEIKHSSNLLSNLSKLNINSLENDIKQIYTELEFKLNKINNFINYINNIESFNSIQKKFSNNVIEYYSN